MKNIEYTLWIDESGEREYSLRTSPYFVYAGIIANRESRKRIEYEMSRIKSAFFKTTDVEFKSNWFRIKKERVKRYLERYNITETELRIITREIYRIIKTEDITLLASVIDKRKMLNKYGNEVFSPSAFAYELILERYQFFLKDKDEYGNVVIDDISGKNPRKHAYKILLNNLHNKLQSYGSTIQKVTTSNVVGKLKFVPSEMFNLIQVADFVAYNVLRQYRDFSVDWENDNMETRMYGHFEEILSKFRKSVDGKVLGYGIVKMP